MATETTLINFIEGAAASTPSANRVVTYAKSDGLLYSKDDAGTEKLMSAGAGGLVFLEAHTASASSTLDFTTFISSTYDEYLFEIISLIPSTTSTFGIRCSVSGTFDTGSNYITSQFVWSSAGTAVGGGTTTSISLFPYAGRTMVTTANYSTSGTLHLYDPQGANYKSFVGRMIGIDSATTGVQPLEVGGRYVSTSAVDGVRFLPSSGNIASGTIRVYGIAKS